MYPLFDKDRQDVGSFIVANFSSKDKINEYTTAIEYAINLPETDAATVNQKESFLFRAYDIAKSVSVSLEDLFTIFDNVAVGREHFRLYSPDNMIRIHNQIKLCVIYALVFAISNSCDDTQYRRFSKLLLSKRLAAFQKDDVISVITNSTSIITSGTFFLHKLKQALIEKGVIKNYSICPLISTALAAMEELHEKVSKIDLNHYPCAIYTLSYQDGVIHAFERFLQNYETGEYNQPGRLGKIAGEYEKWAQDCFTALNFWDASYFEGYTNGLILIETCDAYFGDIRTVIPGTSGQRFGIIRTTKRKHPDSISAHPDTLSS